MSAPTNLNSRGGMRDLPPDWIAGTEWTPPDGHPIERYAQPDTARPTLAELLNAVRRLWRHYRNTRANP